MYGNCFIKLWWLDFWYNVSTWYNRFYLFIFHSFLDFPPFRFRQQKSFIRNFMVVKKATIIITRNTNTSIKKYCHHESSDPGLFIVSSGLGCRIKYSIHQTARSTGCIGWSITKSCKWLMAVWYLDKEHYNHQIFWLRECIIHN